MLLSCINNSKATNDEQCSGDFCISATKEDNIIQQLTTRTPLQQAYFTFYESYPMCCPDSPNYDSNAPIEDCDDFSCCDYSGK